MEFRIADTFTSSLARLTNQEQKAAKTTAFDLQLNPVSTGLQFHKLDRVKDPNFWSVRVNLDLRLIVHRTDTSLLLCYVDHHDDAYSWARRRKIERHPRTGAAQLVEVRETVEEIIIPQTVTQPSLVARQSLLFSHISEDDLLSYGVPQEWLADVRQLTEDRLFEIVDHLPQEAAEALLELATGGTPQKPTIVPEITDPFSHPDAQRRFRMMTNVEELALALDFPWEKWTIFLHPSQQSLVTRHFSGPARISGSAGTGKTIVALHRTVFLARQNPSATLLLTTFSRALAQSLQIKLERLVGNQPQLLSRIRVSAIQSVAGELYTKAFGDFSIANPDSLKNYLIATARQHPDCQFSPTFLWNEWQEVVDAWQLDSWEAYRDVPRLGRKTRMGIRQREILWQIFEQVQTWLTRQGQLTWPGVFRKVTETLSQDTSPFDFAIVDECQDMGIPELRFLASLGQKSPDSLFFTGDLGQRIFQQPFSWKSLGVNIRGRSHTLNINYRTSHQIRTSADALLPKTITDVDGNSEQRQFTISVFNGPAPEIVIHGSAEQEVIAVAQWLNQRLAEGVQPEEIGVFVRQPPQLERAKAAVNRTGIPSVELDTEITPASGSIAVSTMHLAKGLEFRAVAVIACDDEVLPLQERIETAADESELEEVYNTERHLLYVACTRARDYLIVSGVSPASEFLDDFHVK